MSERQTVSWWMVFALVVLLTSVGSGRAVAQGSFELYLGSYFPEGEEVDEDLTYGIRAGSRFSDRFGLQGTLGRYETEIDFIDLETTFADLSLVWFTNPGHRAEFSIYGGPGWAFLKAEADSLEASDGDSLTAHFGAGLNIPLSDRFFLRPEVRARWFEEGGNEIDVEATLACGIKFLRKPTMGWTHQCFLECTNVRTGATESDWRYGRKGSKLNDKIVCENTKGICEAGRSAACVNSAEWTNKNEPLFNNCHSLMPSDCTKTCARK